MKFKVGDRVRVVRICGDDAVQSKYSEYIGKIAKIIASDNSDDYPYVLAGFPSRWDNHELELVNESERDNMTESEKLRFSKLTEDDKELRTRGITDNTGELTCDGTDAFVQYLLEKEKTGFVAALKDADPKKEEK